MRALKVLRVGALGLGGVVAVYTLGVVATFLAELVRAIADEVDWEGEDV